MGDRRPSFFSRVLLSILDPRRTTARRRTQQSSPFPPSDETSSDSTTATPATPSTAGNANARSPATPPASETISAGQTTTSTPTPTTLPIAETQKAEKETNLTTNAIPTTPATTETQTAGQATTPSSTTPLTDETQSQTPSQSNRSTTLAATMPPSSEAQMDNQTTITSIVPTQPASPFRATTKSPSPPQPSSPSRVVPQSPVMPSSRSPQGSVTPLTPQRTSKLQSPSRSASRSPNQISSPSTKGVQHTTEEIPHPLSNSHEAPNTISNGEAPKPATSEQEPPEIQSKTTTSTPTPTTLPIAETQKAEKETNLTTNAIPTTPATTETQTAGQATTPSSTTPLTDETQSQTPSESNRSTTLAATMPPSSEAQMDNQTNITSIVPTQPASPFRATTKSPSPPQPSSPSRVASQSPIMPSSRSPQGSVTPLTPQRTSKLQSPSRSASRSPNQISSPSTKGIQHTTEEIPHPLSNSHEAPNTVSNGEAPKLATSEQEPLENQSKTTTSTPKFTQSSREPVPLHKEIKDDILTFFNRMAIRDPKNPLNDKPVSVITLAGENRGALMHLGSDSSKGEGAIHIHRGYKINPDESPEATIDGEGSWKGKTSEDAEGKEDQPREAYLNNNTQGINNSIVFKSSIAERNPGVYMIVTHAQKEPTKSTDEKMPLEVQKAEFNAIPIQKLTYESNVRRRCLQGLLLESSDSDPENPEKPKRHGCRVG